MEHAEIYMFQIINVSILIWIYNLAEGLNFFLKDIYFAFPVFMAARRKQYVAQ